MQGANKTINTKVGLDLPMSEQVRQRQVTLNEGKTLVNTKGVLTVFSNVKHATSTAGYTVNEMGGSAREIVLDIVNEFGCRNDSGGIYKLTRFTLGYSTGKSTTKW